MMGIFDFLKKRQEELPMPPPPTPPEMPPMIRGDIEEIKVTEEHIEPPLPELPPALPAPAREEEVPVFDRTISKPEKLETVRPTIKPTFVAVEDYKRIINDTNMIRGKLMEAENFVRRLGDIKNEEERAFEKWRTHLEDVEKKLGYVDQLIAKADR
ncbi:Uncharacterised protein [uncultured archaeon]|nr:Uncharacterised protein [uncultured archaeon]